MKLDISVVIPTCNRKESLFRTLQSINQQLHIPKEVIIVDASTEPLNENSIKNYFPKLTIKYHTSSPSVCKQRNLGIKIAQSQYIFLCDDDIEVPEDYLLKIYKYLMVNPKVDIATGYVLQKDKNDEWVYQYTNTSFLTFLWNFIFQLSVWGDFSEVKTNIFTKSTFLLIKNFYAKRGNTYTLAGWPLITEFTEPVTRASIYGLGASVIKKEWLLSYPFAEFLIPNGIGDNYGITVNSLYEKPVHILAEAYVYHHHAPENRLKEAQSYQYRIFALHYFIKKSKRFKFINILFLYWSLIGNTIYYTFKQRGDMVKASFKTLVILVTEKNPYLKRS